MTATKIADAAEVLTKIGATGTMTGSILGWFNEWVGLLSFIVLLSTFAVNLYFRIKESNRHDREELMRLLKDRDRRQNL